MSCVNQRPGCDRGFGPAQTWRGYHQVIDHWAAKQPSAAAVEDPQGVWSYAELQAASLSVAKLLLDQGLKNASTTVTWADRPQLPRPLAIWLPRGREFMAICVGAWRLGLPVVAMSRDMPDQAKERARNEQIMQELKPFALISDERAAELLTGAGQDCTLLPYAEMEEALRRGVRLPGSPEVSGLTVEVTPETLLTYVYTGGTTKASKCCTVTHGMALWEAENYHTAVPGRVGGAEKMLQYSSLYWGAAVFGQISLGFAFGACVCIGGCLDGQTKKGGDLQQLKNDVERFQITVLGVVPSQLRGAWPDGPRSMTPSVRILVAWADKCPVDLSRLWTTPRIQVVELLIASEYWLALHSDCKVWDDGTLKKHIYRRLPGLDARFMTDDGQGGLRDANRGEVGEMFLAGPTTSPGYVCPDGHVGLDFHEKEQIIDGKVYYRTSDQLLLLQDGGLVYHGRADSMMKHGGQWFDTDVAQDTLNAVPGVTNAAVLSGADGIDAFVVLHSSVLTGGAGEDGEDAGTSPSKRTCVRKNLTSPQPFRVLAAVRRALPSSTPGGCRIHLRTSIPLNSATAKIDRKALQAELDDLRDEKKKHAAAQDRMEDQAIRFYRNWAGVTMLFQCGPQILLTIAGGLVETLAAGGALPTASAMPMAVGLETAKFTFNCLARCLAMPQLYVAMQYFEDQMKEPKQKREYRWKDWETGPWVASLLERAPALKGYLEQNRWQLSTYFRWFRMVFPVAVSAFLPAAWVGRMVVAAMAYLAWIRERDNVLTAGLSGAAAALMVPDGLLPGGVSSAAAAATIGASSLALRPRSAAELAKMVLAAPGLAWQVLPSSMADTFCAKVPKYLGGIAEESLRMPNFREHFTLNFDSKAAVVDVGNQWNQVYLMGDSGHAWNSIGVRVHLDKALQGDTSPLAPFLGDAGVGGADPRTAANGAANGHAANGAGANGTNGHTAAGGGTAAALASLVERICGQGEDALQGLDSMQAIQLSEGVRRELKKALGVADVLACTDVEQLTAAVERAVPMDGSEQTRKDAKILDERRPWRVWLCGLGPGACTVDWMVSRKDSDRHLDLAAMQRATDRLVERHAALRTRNACEQPMFDATYAGASLWQLWNAGGRKRMGRLGQLASGSVYQAWPRSFVLPSSEASVRLLLPTVKQVRAMAACTESDDQMAFWISSELGNTFKAQNAEDLFYICVMPVFRAELPEVDDQANACEVALSMSPDEVRWYVYAVLDHGYCDGPTGLPLFADLLRLYGEESGEAPAQTQKQQHSPAEALSVLQDRLLQSLKPMPEAEHPNNDIFHDGLLWFGHREGYQRHIRFDEHLMQLLRVASRDNLGCSVDVAWLTTIAAAFLRMFPDKRRLDLYLIVTCRDGPGQETMIGYFSSRKLMPLEVGDPSRVTLMGLADLISTARRQRTWRRARPFEKSTAIEVNIVSQAADGLPLGFQEVRCSRSAPRDWSRKTNGHLTLRLDQTARDDWDFRLQSHDKAYGSHWSSYYAQALGSVLVDMALRPSGAIVPAP